MPGKKKKQYDDDDGRVIAPMNVPGMPWRMDLSDDRRHSPEREVQKEESSEEPIELTREEKGAMLRGVLGATLLLTGVFVGVFTLFILFCVYVWFR